MVRSPSVAADTTMINDQPIPLYDGEIHASIRHESADDAAAGPALRGKRAHVRRHYEGVGVCFSPQHDSGRPDHAECPVLNISATGMAIEFDQPLRRGLHAEVSYLSMCGRRVHVSCVVRHCQPTANGHYLLGLQLDRKLSVEEMRPPRRIPGRCVDPAQRARQLRTPPNRNQSDAARSL